MDNRRDNAHRVWSRQHARSQRPKHSSHFQRFSRISSVNHRLAIYAVVQFNFSPTVGPASTERSARIALRLHPPPTDTTDLYPPPPDTTDLQLRGSLQAVQMPIWTAIDIVSTPRATISRTVKTIRGTSQQAISWRAGRACEHTSFPQFGQHAQCGNQSGLGNEQNKGS
jgi:hypothetical protein